jgi:hypothetical protein
VRMVGALLLVVMPLVVAAQEPAESEADASSAAGPPVDRFTPVGELAGHCWTGTFPDGKARDLHCFEWVLQNRFLRDRHRVTGPDGVYEGDSYYRWNEAAERLEFWYFNSLGGVSTGTMEPRDGRWLFLESYEGADESSQQIRSWLSREDERSYTVTTERLEGGTWKTLWSMRLMRTDVRRGAGP